MAKLSSTARPASRQSGETLAPPSGRVIRSTRSQSRNVSEEPAPSTGVSPKKKSGRRSRKAAQDLATVDEDAAPEEQQQAQTLAAEQKAAPASDGGGDEDAANTRRGSEHSQLSGTTVKTSFSQEEIQQLDPFLIVDSLGLAYTAALEMAKHFMSAVPKSRPVIWKEIRQEGSNHNKRFRLRLNALNLYKPNFGSQEYIQPSILLRAFLGVPSMDDVPGGRWRPDAVIHEINLVQMLRTLLVMKPDPVYTLEDLDNLALLDDAFPTTIAGPGFEPQAMDVCISLQTQAAIARLSLYSSDPNFSVHEVVTDVFLAVDEMHELLYKHIDGLHLRDGAEPQDQQHYGQIIDQRINTLVAPFSKKSAGAAVAELRAAFTWDAFIDQIIRYYEVRKAQLDHQIFASGSIDDIVSNMSQELDRRTAARESAKRESLVKTGTSPRKSFSKTGLAALKAREQRLSGAGITQPVAAPGRNTTADRPSEAIDIRPDDDFADVDEVATRLPQQSSQQPISKGMASLIGFQNVQAANARKEAAKKGKSKAIAEQPSTQRVSWDEQTQQRARNAQSNFPTSLAPRPHPSSSNKRSNHEIDDELEEFDPTPDEGFQTDTRGTTGAGERREEAAAMAVRQRPESRPSSSAVGMINSGYRVPTESPSKRQRKNPGASVPPPLAALDPDMDGEIPSSTFYERAKIAAKQNRVRTAVGRVVQVRNPWTQEEEEALIELIETEGGDGVSYAALKNIDSCCGDEAKLVRRSAEDIRFKARNMKKTMIIAHQELPQNWQYIALDKKLIDLIRARGIYYEQDRIRQPAMDE